MDIALVTRAQHGDEEAFATLTAAIGDRLNAVAHRILRDTNLAEDATQQALLTIWRTLPQLRDPALCRRRLPSTSMSRAAVAAMDSEPPPPPAHEPAVAEGLSSIR